MLVLYLAGAGSIAWLAWRGWSFYQTELALRPRHPDWDLWHPGAPIGHGLGIAGTLLILLMLLYIPRKRFQSWEKLGPLRKWLDVHIWMGIFGPLLIMLHSTFKVGGLVSFSFWSMVAVALSGVLGRYLYLQIPRGRSGQELSSSEIRTELDQLSDPDLASHSTPTGPPGGPINWILQDITWLLERRGRMRALRDRGSKDPRRVLALQRRRLLLQRRFSSLEVARKLLHHWHVFHRPFALIMILFMLLHIITVLLFGVRWLHGGA